MSGARLVLCAAVAALVSSLTTCWLERDESCRARVQTMPGTGSVECAPGQSLEFHDGHRFVVCRCPATPGGAP